MTKKVLVTGATRGIGREVCEKFLSKGYEVVGIARKSEDLPWPIITCDLSDINQLESCFKVLTSRYGVFDVLVNNAATYFGASAAEETIEQYEITMNVNVKPVFRLTQLFAKELQTNQVQGAIVNVSSISGRIGSIDPAYAASKAAIDALTKSFARSYAANGIRVNAVAPGPVNTDLASRIPEERKQQFMKSILLQRFAEANEIANLIFFLASDESSFMTGEIVYISGGIL